MRSPDRLRKNRGNVDELDLAVGRGDSVALVDGVGDNELLDGEILQVVHGRFRKES